MRKLEPMLVDNTKTTALRKSSASKQLSGNKEQPSRHSGLTSDSKYARPGK
jgi:hypothetical protein